MKRSLVRLFLALLPLGAWVDVAAQTTAVSAPSGTIQITGAAIASGSAVLMPVDSYGHPIAVTTSGGLSIPGSPARPVGYSCTITSGAITGCSVPDEVAASPSGFRYDVTISDSASGKAFTLRQVPGITGTTFRLDRYTPAATVPTIAALTHTIGSGAPTSTCTEPAQYFDRVAHVEYECSAGAWIQLGGSGSTFNGGTVTNPITLPNDPTQALQAATKQYVDNHADPAGAADAARIAAQVYAANAGNLTSGTVGAARLPAIHMYPPLMAPASPASTTFLQALNNAATQPVSILVIGDSFSIADQTNSSAGPTVSTNRWPEWVRTHLQDVYGSHGTGMVPVIVGMGTSPASVNPEEYSISGTYDTLVSVLGPTETTNPGNSLVHLNSGASITFSDVRGIKWDTLHVYGATSASSGALTCVADGATAIGTLSTGSAAASGASNGGYTARRWDMTALPLATHSVVCTASGGFYVYAFHGTAGAAGVEVHLHAFGGATSNAFGANAAQELAFADLISGGVQAVVVMDQTNDVAFGISASTFATNLQNVITHEQSLSSAPVVMLAIPPVDVVDGTHPMAAYTAAQLALCSSNGLTCTNIQARSATIGGKHVGWGTSYDAASGLWDMTGGAWPAGNAGVHPDDAGSIDEGQQIYATLTNPPNASATSCTTQTLSSSAASVTFSSIAQGYLALKLYLSATGTDVSAQNVNMTANGDGAAHYAVQYDALTNGTYSSGDVTNPLTSQPPIAFPMPGTGAPSGSAIESEITISNYAGGFLKYAHSTSLGTANISVDNPFYLTRTTVAWFWDSSAAITSVTLTPNAGSFASGSTFSLCGVR